jgi:trk system potassium uptake protein TrkA
MRAVFIGAGAIAVMTTRTLLKRGHEVVIIERDKARIDALGEELDCGFILGDGGKPAILREADAERTDFLFCVTAHDQSNIIASLVGRSLGFKRVVTRIEDPEFEHICIELGLEDTIVPTRTIGRYLADMFAGHDPLELSAMIKDEARVFSFVISDDEVETIAALDLPKDSRVICCYRDGKFTLPGPEDTLRIDDEVVIITHSRNVSALEERWGPRTQRRFAH